MHIYRISKPKSQIQGNILCSGSKNIAVKVLIASLLTKEIVTLYNLPDIGDVKLTIALLESLGVTCTYIGPRTLQIDPSNLQSISHMDSCNRVAISLYGILAHWFDHACLPKLSGCKLGERGVDVHMKIYHSFGINLTDQIMYKQGPLFAQHIILAKHSVGATETALFLAVLARGRSIIENIAIEPEVRQVIKFLTLMGARITWLGYDKVQIDGVDKLYGTNFSIDFDRLEAVSWPVLALLHDGRITVSDIDTEVLQSPLGYLTQLGLQIDQIGAREYVFSKRQNVVSQNITLLAGVYPKLATDQLPQLSTLVRHGGLHDYVYESRMLDVSNMFNSFGITHTMHSNCNITNCRLHDKYQHYITIDDACNVQPPSASITLPTNIRCAKAYLLLASTMEREVELIDVSCSIARGYENLPAKLADIGINVSMKQM